MNLPLQTAPGRIRAAVHESVISRVTRMYSSSLEDIFGEIFQNSRRAGATHVDVTIVPDTDNGSLSVSIVDNGAGISVPSLLLSYGVNGWDRELVRREDAAGMGFLSLARRGCTVLSRPRGAVGEPIHGWKAALGPEHFTGEAEADVEIDDSAPHPHGTAVSFHAKPGENSVGIGNAVRSAARYFPLPVSITDGCDDHKTTIVARRAFLDGAEHAETWNGLTFGVFRGSRIHRGDPNVNFHGHTLRIKLPVVSPIVGNDWSVLVDVTDCPDLELVLPARKEAVETPFLEKMREAAKLVIWRAMANAEDPCPAFADWDEARQAGIFIEPPAPMLQPWRPDVADIDSCHDFPDRRFVDESCLLVDARYDAPKEQAFWRAACKYGPVFRNMIYVSNDRLQGYDWYDSLERIVDIDFRLSLGRKVYSEADYPLPARDYSIVADLPQRPDAICFEVTVRPGPKPRDPARGTLFLNSDLAFVDTDVSFASHAPPVVAKETDLAPHELSEILRNALFCPSDDIDADSRDRQEDDFIMDAQHIAMRILESDEAALRGTIYDALHKEVSWLIPHGVTARISIRKDKIEVDLEREASAAGGPE